MTTSIFSIDIPTSEIKLFKKIGDHVLSGECIFEFSQSVERIEIDIARELQSNPKIALSYVTKNLGDNVSKGEVVAKRKKGLIFQKNLQVTSPHDGKIFELDNFSGKIVISETPRKIEVVSPVSGKIKEITDKIICIEYKGEEVVPKRISGGVFFAEILRLSKWNEEVDDKLIDENASGKILYGGIFSLTDLNRAMAFGAKAVIGAKFSESVSEKFGFKKTYDFLNKQMKVELGIAEIDEKDSDCFEKTHVREVYFDSERKNIIIPHASLGIK